MHLKVLPAHKTILPKFSKETLVNLVVDLERYTRRFQARGSRAARNKGEILLGGLNFCRNTLPCGYRNDGNIVIALERKVNTDRRSHRDKAYTGNKGGSGRIHQAGG
ncbi:hypothetical protein DL546_007025 [Coniochaeta pulveracea]|uniref:Uncharacterized protein n=1 Tax=Coniochaeta pulveracea TaxID=177199 RepID=A0A420Y851_9PEZI|nr:hypothetical protein DL546_007025 [Coniochaeta pulveracea]